MRVISHTCSNTEIICALGLSDYIVGVDEHSDYPLEVVQDLPTIGPDLDIDINKIIALAPDLVVTSLTVPGHEKCIEKLEQAGLSYLVTEPVQLDDIPTDIEHIAAALGHVEKGNQLANEFKQQLEQEHLKTQQLNLDPIPILIEWWPKPVIVPAQDSWVNQMLKIVGAYNPWQDQNGKSMIIDAEQATASNAAAVVMSWCGVKEEKYHSHIVKQRDDWQSLPALQNNKIFPISEAYLGRPGPRLIQGIQRLREVVASIASN